MENISPIIAFVAGDIIGSRFERKDGGIKKVDFDLFTQESVFTDDTVLTIAIADALQNNLDVGKKMHEYGNAFPDAGYGGNFIHWLKNNTCRKDSFGNGASMRTAPVALFYNDLGTVLKKTAEIARITHDHPEAIHWAQAVSASIFLAWHGKTPAEVVSYLVKNFEFPYPNGYSDDERQAYVFSSRSAHSVPQAIACALLYPNSVEKAIREAVSWGGDSDTQACIAGGITACFVKKIPKKIVLGAMTKLDHGFIHQITNFVPSKTISLI
jgi:ADP-ribosyl-[dinitrogen reductase] hydrolase